ncbi:hypothetical protein KIN20_029980 [Parelaphostrongylus tenuis]|uniref:SCP domain-containing protein n=1 Tax=Parelaphostrongylus tenuis TaxID=148309 RepID=A0AAD5WG08_PARTN|nr:hypothetical protein KIN20_029980 [Parelaphostrongylus tenuis]
MCEFQSLHCLRNSLTSTLNGCRALELREKIGIIVAAVLLIFFAIGLPLLITPGGEDIEDCGGPMTPEYRKKLLQGHNKYRSQLAKGEYNIIAPNSAIKVLPTATRMIQLVSKFMCAVN